MCFSFDAKANLIQRLKNNSEGLYAMLLDVFEDEDTVDKISDAIDDLKKLISKIENSTDEELDAKIQQAYDNLVKSESEIDLDDVFK